MRVVRSLNGGISELDYVITTYSTSRTELFREIINRSKINILLIADECHNFGAPQSREKDYNFINHRIGLSATPDRWFDVEGTSYIKDYFRGVVFEYSLEEAIETNKLTPYFYTPIKIRPTKDEVFNYKKLTTMISIEYDKKVRDIERITNLLRKRSDIISKSQNKIPMLISMLELENIKRISHTLIYCSPGEISIITKKLSLLGLRVHRFDYKVPIKERMELLKRFDLGEIQVLIAINCLDEGVDIPSTRTAYFLASTSNPRQFIQRRGRVLRKYDGKVSAEIYDFIVLPAGESYEVYKQFASKELPRFAEFSRAASNKSTAINSMFQELLEYDLNHLLYKGPWEVYRERQEHEEL